MSKVTDLGDLWERQAIAELKRKRNDAAAQASKCRPGGEYGAQILRMVSMYDRMIAAAQAQDDGGVISGANRTTSGAIGQP